MGAEALLALRRTVPAGAPLVAERIGPGRRFRIVLDPGRWEWSAVTGGQVVGHGTIEVDQPGGRAIGEKRAMERLYRRELGGRPDRHSSAETAMITENVAIGNAGGDLADNTGCRFATWRGNVFETAVDPCIH